MQVNELVWGPPGGRRYQTLGKLDAKSEVDLFDEDMDVDEDDEDEDDEDGCKTSFEEQVPFKIIYFAAKTQYTRFLVLGGWSDWK